MSTSKEKHPSWFKMKLERRTMVKQLKPRVAVNVLLACWEFLETGEKPTGLSPIESIAFSAFIPDLEDAWATYIKRISSGTNGGRPPKDEKPYGSICPHSIPCDTVQNHAVPHGTEEEPEPEQEQEQEPKKGCKAAKRPARPRFLPPTVERVAEYVKLRGSRVDPQGFVDFYAAKGWLIGKTPMKDWKAACRNAESWERWEKSAGPEEPKSAKRGRLIVGEDGEEVAVFDA